MQAPNRRVAPLRDEFLSLATQMAIFRGPAMKHLNRVCRCLDAHYLVLLLTVVAVIMTLTGTKQEESAAMCYHHSLSRVVQMAKIAVLRFHFMQSKNNTDT